MEAKQLLDLVSRYEENREFITNEETTKMALIVPFIRHLGYDPNSPREVRLEYAAEFTHGDGKRLPDRMDYAIFDQTGKKPLMVIEAKPLGFDLATRSQQLARYLAPDARSALRNTDRRMPLPSFSGDLEAENQMDQEPFFRFALDDVNSDWARIGAFLAKFSREAFNAETLVTDAEGQSVSTSHNRQDRKRLCEIPGLTTAFFVGLPRMYIKASEQLGLWNALVGLVKEAIEPALMNVLEDDFLDDLKQRFVRVRETPREGRPSRYGLSDVNRTR